MTTRNLSTVTSKRESTITMSPMYLTMNSGTQSLASHRSLWHSDEFSYVTVHPRARHLSLAGMSPFFCGYTTFHPQVCPLLLVGMTLFTLEFINFHSWVRHLSLARIISSSRGYVTFRSRICHHSLVGMSPFNSSTADLPKHTRNLFFCNKAFILVSRSLLFSFTHVNNVFFLTC